MADTITIEDFIAAKKALDEAAVEPTPPYIYVWKGRWYPMNSNGQFTDEDGNTFNVKRMIEDEHNRSTGYFEEGS